VGSGYRIRQCRSHRRGPLAPGSGAEVLRCKRLFLEQIEQHVADGRDFAFETTLAGRGYLDCVRRLRSAGWRVEILYLALPSVELSRLRVAERVAHGAIPSTRLTLSVASHAACGTSSSCMRPPRTRR